MTADDVIKKLLDNCRPDNTLAVTVDHVLCAQAYKHGIPTIDPDAFMLQVKKSRKQKPAPHAHKATHVQKRPGHISSHEIDALMAQTDDAALHKDTSPIEFAESRRSTRKKPSKQEKLFNRIIEKL